MEERYLKMLHEVKNPGDPEAWHCAAEDIMLAFLREAGFIAFANEYEQQATNWWYA